MKMSCGTIPWLSPSLLNMQRHSGVWRRIFFGGGDNLRGDCAVSSCPGWNAGAWPHIPHRGSTPDTQGSQCSGRRLTNAASHGWAWFFSPNTKVNSLHWTPTLFLLCTKLLLHRHTHPCSLAAGAAPALQFMGMSNERIKNKLPGFK